MTRVSGAWRIASRRHSWASRVTVPTPGAAPADGASAGSADSQNAAPVPAGPTRAALLQRYCVTCHNDRAKTGGLSLARLDVDHPETNTEVWEKAIRKLRAGLMPPAGRAAARPRRARRISTHHRGVDRSRRHGEAESRARPPASAEPHRIRQRHPRPAGARRRCVDDAAGGRLRRRLRQHRRRPRHVAGAHRALHRRGVERSAAWRLATPTMGPVSVTYKVRGDLRRIATSKGCRSAHAAASCPPQLPRRRRISVQVLAAEGELRPAVRRRREGRTDRDERKRRARAASRPAIDDLLLHPRRRSRTAGGGGGGGVRGAARCARAAMARPGAAGSRPGRWRRSCAWRWR